MKTQRLALITLILVQSAFAQTQTPTLKATMDSIGALVGTIVKSANDPSKNVNSAASAEQLVTLFTTALKQTPDSISALPAPQQAAALNGYQSLIQKEIADAQALQKAFLSNDNASASGILQDMNTLKSQGHSTYAK